MQREAIIRIRIASVEAALAANRRAGKSTGRNYRDLHALIRELKALRA